MKTKTFDCVEMKRQIQEQILKEAEGLSTREQAQKAEREIHDDPVLGPIWRRDKQSRTRERA